MRSSESYAELLKLGRPLIQTSEAAARLQLGLSSASHLLASLEKEGLVRRIRRGLWALQPNPEPFSVPPYLTAPFPAYVSFWSALARHGMIEQIPRSISVTPSTLTAPDARQRRSASTRFTIWRRRFSTAIAATSCPATSRHRERRSSTLSIPMLRRAGASICYQAWPAPKLRAGNQLAGWLGRIERPRLQTLVARGLSTALNQAQEG